MNNFNLSRYLKSNTLLSENVGGYVDLNTDQKEDVAQPTIDVEGPSNEKMVQALSMIKNLYNNQELDNMDWKGVVFHLDKAIELINSRSGD